MGGCGKIIGFLRVSHPGVISRVSELVAATKKGRFRVLITVSDALTGLTNSWRLSNVLETELDNSHRTRRPFSVDMDGLKAINDQFGHLSSSRPLVRLGKIPDPEAGREVATRVVARIRERLAKEPERPTLSVCARVATLPQGGDAPEQVLGAADRAPYGKKNRGGSIQNLTRMAACL